MSDFVVCRGGSWFFNFPSYFRCAYHNFNQPSDHGSDFGFRVARTVKE